MSLKSALDLAKREIKLLCEVATEKLRGAGLVVDPPRKTYKHILKRIDDEAGKDARAEAEFFSTSQPKEECPKCGRLWWTYAFGDRRAMCAHTKRRGGKYCHGSLTLVPLMNNQERKS